VGEEVWTFSQIAGVKKEIERKEETRGGKKAEIAPEVSDNEILIALVGNKLTRRGEVINLSSAKTDTGLPGRYLSRKGTKRKESERVEKASSKCTWPIDSKIS